MQVASRAVSGPIVNDAGALRIGGNGIWPEWFAGRIDEVRLYNRALPAAELQSDMASAGDVLRADPDGDPVEPVVQRRGRRGRRRPPRR